MGAITGQIKVFDLEDSSLVITIIHHFSAVNCLVLSGRFLFSASSDGSASIWEDFAHKEQVIAGNPVTSIAYEGENFVTGDDKGMVKLWDIETRDILQEFKGHSKIVTVIAVSPDFIISGSIDRNICVWSIQKRVKRYFNACADCIVDLSFAGHSHFLSGNQNGSIQKWNLMKRIHLISGFDPLINEL